MDAVREIKLSPKGKIVTLSIIAVLGLVFLFAVRHILTPFLWALMAAYILNPLVDWLKIRTRLRRGVVVLLIYLVMGALLAFGLSHLIPFLASEIQDLRMSYPQIIRSLQERIMEEELLASLGLMIDAPTVTAAITQALGRIPQNALNIVTFTLALLVNVFVFLVVTFYLLLDSPKIVSGMFGLIPEGYRAEFVALSGKINKVLNAYIRGLLFLIVLMSTVTWIFISPILHLRYALVISLATGILEIIPIVGPVTAGAIAALVAFVQPNVFGWSNWAFTLAVVAVYFVLRHAEDYLVIPNILGRAVRIHPLIVIFAVVAGALLGGVTGMFMAIPVVAVLRVLIEYLYNKLRE